VQCYFTIIKIKKRQPPIRNLGYKSTFSFAMLYIVGNSWRLAAGATFEEFSRPAHAALPTHTHTCAHYDDESRTHVHNIIVIFCEVFKI
jgi:hypothetical protein